MFLVQLKLRRRRGFLQIFLAAGVLALLVPMWFMVQGMAGAMVITTLAGSVLTITGVSVALRGMLQIGRATRHQLAVNELRQLPVARARLLGP